MMRDLDGIWFRVSGFGRPNDLHVGSLCRKFMLNNIRRGGQKIAIFWRGYRFFALYLRRKEIPAEKWAESPRGKVYC